MGTLVKVRKDYPTVGILEVARMDRDVAVHNHDEEFAFHSE